MDELCFGLASFVFLISEKGYILQTTADNWIAFWQEGQNHKIDSYQVMYKSKSDCGYVVFNPVTFEEKFANDENLLNDLRKLSLRQRRTVNGSLDVAHCFEPKHETEITDGVIIRCGRIKE